MPKFSHTTAVAHIFTFKNCKCLPLPIHYKLTNPTNSEKAIEKQKSTPLLLQEGTKSEFCYKDKKIMEDVDWDLHAVVRSCINNNNSNKCGGANFGCNNFNSISEQAGRFCFSSYKTDPFFEAGSPVFGGDLDDLYKPFFPKSHVLYSSTSQFATTQVSNPHLELKQQQQPQQKQKELSQFRLDTTTRSANASQSSRSKKRKNQLKRVCQVAADALSSDAWAWRKYGQKPIKGSPYPRGYYRCSSFKGCMARKQVERNRSEPGMFIVTYTGEHNHRAPTQRNSLAGSTRQKPPTPQTVTSSGSNNLGPSPSKPASTPTSSSSLSSPVTSPEEELAPQSTNSESRDIMEDKVDNEDDDQPIGFSDLEVDDDFFMGLEEFDIPMTGDVFSDCFAAGFSPPNLAC